jgi:nicotinate-nucleotide adenylyltransferase
MKKEKTGLFFGSFNPVHNGHMIIASFMIQQTDLDSLWFVVSPLNPLKEKNDLTSNTLRLEMVKLAIGENDKMLASDVEFHLPTPSYTIHTLRHLEETNPEREFVLIIGGDNLAIFHKWKEYQQILRSYPVYVYRRPGYSDGNLGDHLQISFFNAPLLEISASNIRKSIKNGLSVRHYVPDAVYYFLKASRIYQ